MSDWQEWKGGQCPVAPGTLVDVEFRGGEVHANIADRFFWGHGKNRQSFEIVAYRLSEPKTTAIPTPSGLKSVEYDSKPDREELRIRAALAAMQGMLSSTEHDVTYQNKNLSVAERIAKDSFTMADAFIEELERRGK